jgi:hypothetical protein
VPTFKSGQESAKNLAGEVSVDAVMAELQGRARERLRQRLLGNGASDLYGDPALFAEVERLLSTATEVGDANALILPELLGEPKEWRLETAMRYDSHRDATRASIIIFVKRRILMPLFRWLFEYSRDNFERQRRVNQVLFACVQELAAETAQLRQQVRHLTPPTASSARPEAR